MDAFRKQASKLREQVAKQQQAVLKQFSGRFGNDSVIADEAEIQYYQQLKRLYISTREAKHLQRDLARGVEDLIYASLKQMDIATKLADNCCRYGSENQSPDSSLARASLNFGTSHNMMEKERDNLHEILDSQVSEPLRTMIKGAPLEDARHLTRQYYRIRQEVEAQAAEVARRQLKSKEAGATADGAAKLQNAESKLSTLKSNMLALGKEATAAMMSVEVQQQRLTFERLVAMVDAERSYHQSVAAILDELYTVMVLGKQYSESASHATATMTDVYVPSNDCDRISNKSGDLGATTEKTMHFIAEVIHSFDAQSEGELSLSVGDYVVVRQVAANGWSEGECNGKAGWFPSAYIERRDRAPESKVINSNANPS
ncbi:Src-3 domain-containing protein [Cinnamomum micranthum f. kanehirae]|uniref:Src-3 domain-containing protein n=1 Tax=Cinnamomum micranthum f. kanehirae TaxID=337451 RepID=A0A3S3N043_9MAGN|nr:Src-3 domain-containing protein [Cinnamomum micranthum f. kanehirae]